MTRIPYNQKVYVDRRWKHFNKILKDNGIDYFLVFGTCLGIIREGGYIEKDDDLDLGMLYNEEKIKKLIDILSKNGYEIRRILYCENNDIKKKYGEKSIRNIHFFIDNILFDMFILYKIENHYILADNWIIKTDLEKLITVEYVGMKLNVPKDYEKFLEEIYKDWKIPTGGGAWDKGWKYDG